MKKLLIISLYLFVYQSLSQTSTIHFTSSPTLTPDAKYVIFSYEGDLWKVNAEGGIANRITAMLGNESRAKVSPDGKWIAFTGGQFGSQDIYLMSTEGGDIKQLTFHEAFEQVDSWSWDSQFIYFTSDRLNRSSGYKVSIKGGTPIRLFENYFNTVHSVVEHPNSGEIFFNETWESRSSANRKRYKGSYNPDIQSYNPKTKKFTQYTDWLGKDFDNTLDRQGNVYFISDEANGEYNLYTFENAKKKALTNFNTSIKSPHVSANGEKVVFEKDYQLWLYDLATKQSKKIDIKLFRNETLEKSQNFEVKGNIENFDVSVDSKKMAFVSRGRLFVSDLKGKFVQEIRTAERNRTIEVKWFSDNKTLLYSMTNKNGYTNWFSISADGKTPEKQLTNADKNDRDITLSKDRSKGVYLSGRDEVRLIDLKTLESKLLVKDEIWGFQTPAPCFSPDGDYVVFTAHRNFEQDIFVHNLKTNETKNLTNTGITETSPIFSPDGKYLYFISDRYKASFPTGSSANRVYRLALTKEDEPYKLDKYNELFAEKPKADTTKKKEEPKVTPSLSIDYENIIDRIELVSPNFGDQNDVFVIQKETKTFVIFSSNHDKGTSNLWKATYEPHETTKTEKIEGATTNNTTIVESSGKTYCLINGDIYTLNLDGNKAEKIDVSFTFRKNLEAEFEQMFYETWANVQENFYNEDFHGIDWAKTKQQYANFLPNLNSRADFRILMNDMLGELNSSHTGFSSSGNEEKLFYTSRTLETGIIFDNDNPYTVKYIAKLSNADKKDKDIKAGDILIKVNDQVVDVNQNRDVYFLKPSLDAELELTFRRDGKERVVKIHPQSYSSLAGRLLYDEWIENNQKIVDEKGKKRIAYAYMKNMGEGELNKFLIEMNTEAYQRDGLILDLRYNTGGNVHDGVINFLSQRPYLKWKYREGAFTVQPNFTPAAKPIVLLINEQSLSDAEVTAQGFKELKLGKIIGNETYRWIIFTSGKGLVDGSFYRLPAWGCYTLDGKNLEKEGVKPDIFIKTTFKDRLENKDPQLEKAIEEVIKDLK